MDAYLEETIETKEVKRVDYKSIIKNKELRLKILGFVNLLSLIHGMLKQQYRLKLGRELNLKNPQRFTEKIQWYKFEL